MLDCMACGESQFLGLSAGTWVRFVSARHGAPTEALQVWVYLKLHYLESSFDFVAVGMLKSFCNSLHPF